MKTLKAWCLVLLVLLWSGVATAQDAVQADPTHYRVVFENASVRVLRINYAAGAKSTMHQHPDAIVIPLTVAKVRFSLPDGSSQDVDMAKESATYSAAGVHSPANIGTATMGALLVEFKAAAAGTATLPTSRPGMTLKTLAEGAFGTAYRATAAPTFQEPAGSKHNFDQVIIALGPSKMPLAIDGKLVKTDWVRGESQFVGRGVPHESRNVSGKAVDVIIVAIK